MATSDKYDRQLRLWGSDGQRRLAYSNVLLVNADACGTETLKNLVLPGVGNFVICDQRIINQEDISSNFFVTYHDIGQSRAAICTKWLLEMNPDVEGDFVAQEINSVLNNGML